MSIEVRGLTRDFGTQRAVDEISFSIPTGAVVGFLGPNGAGKSTTMKMLTGYLPPTSGEILICGRNILENPPDVKKRTGYLPEHNPLYPDMYVEEYLMFVAGLYQIPNKREAVKRIISETGLTPERTKKIGALSKGYRQRVGLAQAMIHDPEVLILDEPTSGLDPNQIHDIRRLISEFGKKRTVLLSTHIMQEVEAMCDRVIIINKGKLVADDETVNLQKRFRPRVILNVEFKNPVKAEQLKGIPGVMEVHSASQNKWKLTAAAGTDLREAVFRFAVDNQNIVLTQSEEEQRLEDIFHLLTRTS